MNRVLVVFSDGLLSELDSARGLVSRSAWIRQAVEDKLMKEAVAPLVPDSWVPNGSESPSTEAFGHGFRELKAEPKPKARRKKSVKDSPVRSGSEDKGDGSSFPAPAESPSLPRFKPQPNRTLTENLSRLPQRCNRGACTGTINPVKGRCVRCNQTPLKESK